MDTLRLTLYSTWITCCCVDPTFDTYVTVRLRVTCCCTVTRAAAFCEAPVAPTPVRPGSTRKFVIPNNFSSRPPTWLDTASDSSAEAPAVLCWFPALRDVPSELVCP